MKLMKNSYVNTIVSFIPQICCFIYIAMVANSNHFFIYIPIVANSKDFFVNKDCSFMFDQFPNFLMKASWIKIEILFFCANFAGISLFTIILACLARCFKSRRTIKMPFSDPLSK